jgi:hypothetical protein
MFEIKGDGGDRAEGRRSTREGRAQGERGGRSFKEGGSQGERPPA